MMEFDDKYLELMGLYKKLRRDPSKETQAEKAFQSAQALVQQGKVSEEARETARYI
jgi:hypothetical protein